MYIQGLYISECLGTEILWGDKITKDHLSRDTLPPDFSAVHPLEHSPVQEVKPYQPNPQGGTQELGVLGTSLALGLGLFVFLILRFYLFTDLLVSQDRVSLCSPGSG